MADGKRNVEDLARDILKIVHQSTGRDDKLDRLRSLLDEALKEGVERERALDQMKMVYLRAGLSDEDEDIVLEVMDFLVGFCSPHAYIRGKD